MHVLCQLHGLWLVHLGGRGAPNGIIIWSFFRLFQAAPSAQGDIFVPCPMWSHTGPEDCFDSEDQCCAGCLKC